MLFCFGGEPKRGQVNAGRFTNHRRSFFDLDWNDLGISLKPPPNENNIPRLSSVRLITEQIQLVAKSDIYGFVGQARKSP